MKREPCTTAPELDCAVKLPSVRELTKDDMVRVQGSDPDPSGNPFDTLKMYVDDGCSCPISCTVAAWL